MKITAFVKHNSFPADEIVTNVSGSDSYRRVIYKYMADSDGPNLYNLGLQWTDWSCKTTALVATTDFRNMGDGNPRLGLDFGTRFSNCRILRFELCPGIELAWCD